MKLFYKNTFPICFLSKSSILIFRKGIFSILDFSNGRVSYVAKFRIPVIESILTLIPLFQRVLRKGIRCGIKVKDDLVLFVFRQRIYELNLMNGRISNGFSTSDNSRPLAFSKIEGINGFEDGIYFGGYKVNPNKNPISIYRRQGIDEWEVLYQFPKNAIEHVHNIIADPHNNIVYILTGDFDHSSGIWKAENGFKSVVPLLIGDQMFRGCIAFPTRNGLVYATDSPFSKNSIRLLKNTGNLWESIHLMDINGPSIYGCKWGNDLVFSTSVESDGRNQDLWYKLFGKTKGEGIIEDYSFIYKGNLEDGFKEIYKAKKDWLPFYLFQFGVLVFPSELNDSSFLPVFHIATVQNNMSTILLELK